MRRYSLAALFILALLGGLAWAGPVYDAIIVRSDLPYDWTVAQAYSHRAQIPVITTSPGALDESAETQLLGFKQAGRRSILVLGGEAAISPSIEAELVDKGFVTHRIREVDRYGTSATVAVELYGRAESVVLVSGEEVSGLLNAQAAAFQTGSPILLVKRDRLPESVREALERLGTREVVLIPSGISEDLVKELGSRYEVKVFPVELGGGGVGVVRFFDVAFGVLLGAVLFALLSRRRRVKLPYDVLTEDEERIVRAIVESGGEIGQDALYERTGFSRPKISRIVSELVERDIIEKRRFKRTFKLKMKKELVKDS